MNEDDIFEKIRHLVSDTHGIDLIEIKRTSRLELDFCIYGDDAGELLVAYSKKFNVDVSQFKFDCYFSGEGIDLIGPLLRLFTGKRRPARERELTIEDLEKGAIVGRLNEEVINANKLQCTNEKSKIFQDLKISYLKEVQ